MCYLNSHLVAKIQYGRARNYIENGGGRRSHVYGGSARWLLLHQHAQKCNLVPGFPMEWSVLCLQSPFLRIGNLTIGILKDHEINSGASVLTKAQNSCLSGQFHRIHEVQVNVKSVFLKFLWKLELHILPKKCTTHFWSGEYNSGSPIKMGGQKRLKVHLRFKLIDKMETSFN